MINLYKKDTCLAFNNLIEIPGADKFYLLDYVKRKNRFWDTRFNASYFRCKFKFLNLKKYEKTQIFIVKII